MAQSLARILVHVVFSTKNRRPFLRETGLRHQLHQYLGGIFRNLEGHPIIVGGVQDHAHLLGGLSRTCTPAELVKELRRGSSLWVKEREAGLQDFAWQNGYGMFSIGASQIEEVERYIAGQEVHHRQVSFQDEFRRLLERHQLDYDERYVWD